MLQGAGANLTLTTAAAALTMLDGTTVHGDITLLNAGGIDFDGTASTTFAGTITNPSANNAIWNITTNRLPLSFRDISQEPAASLKQEPDFLT